MRAVKRFGNILVAVLTAAVLMTAVMVLVRGNRALMLTRYSVTDSQIPQAFDGFRIAQVSDLHNTAFGDDNGDLLALLRQAEPDIIAITGDLIDFGRTDVEIALSFVREAGKIAPCFYVAGNHDPNIGISAYREFEARLTKAGVKILNDDVYSLVRDAQTLTVSGIGDPVYSDLFGGIGNTMDPRSVKRLTEKGDYTVLLSHRPDFIDCYAEAEVELVLSGHAHGGQFRFPGLKGLWAPNQGAFPAYTAGMYVENGTTMVVSRGLGNSTFPLRINNRPELVVVELHSGI